MSTPTNIRHDYAPKDRRVSNSFETDAPVTWCDRCALVLGAVFIFAPIVLFWCERFLSAGGAR